jgi:hypothetical protein
MNAIIVSINGVEYRIGYDSSLALRDTYGQAVELAPGVLHGLSVALRWPGVRAILNAVEQARQRQEGGED